jgi:[ribosomal protein S5]-alanine N-acetyltransferase
MQGAWSLQQSRFSLRALRLCGENGYERVKLPMNFPYCNDRLVIREFRVDDREDLMDFARDPSQLQYMLFKLGTEKELDDFLEYAQSTAKEKNRLEWHLALEEKGKPGCIGGVALMVEKDAPSSAEVGYWLKRTAWGQGHATEATRCMLEFGFLTLGLHRIWGKCHSENAASAHVMEKLGMAFEGRIREHAWLRDHYRTSLLYSMLDYDYSFSPKMGTQ